MSWAVVTADSGDVHAMPWDDDLDAIGGNHVIERSCPCSPKIIRDSPLDDAVWSHQAPEWPGALPETAN